ncbi:MAG: class I SAM-dependent methyltransferase [Pelagimonas sp.]|jgi:SAM-dependent methyltransferase|nr:class I SAM-dependent methyltransferase [Pelagimonas sp.]
MWNDRYNTPDYVYGTAPTGFLTDHAGMIPAQARVLCVADGEGRNSVWLARQGARVTAFDPSENALAKARALADQQGVRVDYHQADFAQWDWTQAFDVVVACFIQFSPPSERAEVFKNLGRAVKSGGRLMLHGYRPEQVALGTGGPPDESYMYTEALLRDSFADMRILRLASYDKTLHEGAGHHGPSALIDLIADAP